MALKIFFGSFSLGLMAAAVAADMAKAATSAPQKILRIECPCCFRIRLISGSFLDSRANRGATGKTFGLPESSKNTRTGLPVHVKIGPDGRSERAGAATRKTGLGRRGYRLRGFFHVFAHLASQRPTEPLIQRF
jgi:hypothetical protein